MCTQCNYIVINFRNIQKNLNTLTTTIHKTIAIVSTLLNILKTWEKLKKHTQKYWKYFAQMHSMNHAGSLVLKFISLKMWVVPLFKTITFLIIRIIFYYENHLTKSLWKHPFHIIANILYIEHTEMYFYKYPYITIRFKFDLIRH